MTARFIIKHLKFFFYSHVVWLCILLSGFLLALISGTVCRVAAAKSTSAENRQRPALNASAFTNNPLADKHLSLTAPTPAEAARVVHGVALSQTALALTAGGQTTLTATVSPDTAADKTVVWRSSNPAVAAVAGGVVTAVAAGACVVTAAASSGVSAACSVAVSAPAPVKSASSAAPPASAPAAKSFVGSAFSGSSQVILITASSMGTIYANCRAFQKSGGVWNQTLTADARVGMNGMVYDSERIEGDLRTPSGVYSLPYAFGTAANPGTKLPYKPIGADTYFDGQYGSPTYDDFVQGKPDNNEWEYMNIGPYKYGLMINFNPEQKVGKGNAIFLHLPTDSGATAGCVSVSEGTMLQLLRWLDPAQNPRIVICPQSDLPNYYR